MSTKFIGEGNIGNIDKRTIANGNDEPKVVISINTHFDNLVRNKKTNELEDQGGFWAPVEFWPQNEAAAVHLINNIFKVGMRIRVEGNLANEKFNDKDTGEERSLMKVKTFQSGISICLQRLQTTTLEPKKQGSPTAPPQTDPNIDSFDTDIPYQNSI